MLRDMGIKFVGRSGDEIADDLRAVLSELLDGGFDVHVGDVGSGWRNIGITLKHPRRRGPKVRLALMDLGLRVAFHKSAPKVQGNVRMHASALPGMSAKDVAAGIWAKTIGAKP